MPGYHPTEVLHAFRQENPHRFDDVSDPELLNALRDVDPDTFKLIDPGLIGAEILSDSRTFDQPKRDEVPKPLPTYRPPPTFGEQVISTGLRTVPGLVGGGVGSFIEPGGGSYVGGAAGMAAGDVVAQAFERQMGTRDDYSPAETLIQGGLGLVPLGEVGGMGPAAATAVRAGQGALLGRAGGLAESLVTGQDAPALPQYLGGAAFGGALHAAGEVPGMARRAVGDLESFDLPTGPPPVAPFSRMLAARQVQQFARDAEAQEISKEFLKRGWDIPAGQKGTLQYGLQAKDYLERLAELGEPPVALPEDLQGTPPPPAPQKRLPPSPILAYGPEGPPPSDFVVPGTPQRGVQAQPTIDRLEEQLGSNLQTGPEGPPRLSTQKQLALTSEVPPPARAAVTPLLEGGPPPSRPQRRIQKAGTSDQPYLPDATRPRPLDRTYAEGPNAGPRREGELHGEPRFVRRRVYTPGKKGYTYETKAKTTRLAEDPATIDPDTRREMARMLHELQEHPYEQHAGGSTQGQLAALSEATGNISNAIAEGRKRGAFSGGATPGAPVYHDILRHAEGARAHATREEVLQDLRAALLEGKGSVISDAAAEVARQRLRRAESGPQEGDTTVEPLSRKRSTRYQTMSKPGAGDDLIGWMDETGSRALPDQDLTPEQQEAREMSNEELRIYHRIYQEGLVPETVDPQPILDEAIRRGIIRPEQAELTMEGPGGAKGPTLFDFEGSEPPKKPEGWGDLAHPSPQEELALAEQQRDTEALYDAYRESMGIPRRQPLTDLQKYEAHGISVHQVPSEFVAEEPPPKPKQLPSAKLMTPEQEAANLQMEQDLVDRYGEDMSQWPAHLRQMGTFKEEQPELPGTEDLPPALNRSRPEAPDYVQRVLGGVPSGAPGLADETSPSRIPALGTKREIIYRGPDGTPVAVARLIQDSAGQWMVEDFAADKAKGLLTGRAVAAVGQKLRELGATMPAGTVTPDAQRLITHAERIPPTQPDLPGTEGVREQEIPTPPVAEAPFALTEPPPKPKRGSKIGQRKEIPPLLRRILEDDGVLILDVPSGDRKGLKKWHDRMEKDHGDETWYNRVEEAMDSGDWDRAWKIAASASVRSYAKAYDQAAGPQQEEMLRRAVRGTPLQADIQTEIVGQARRKDLRTEPHAPTVTDFPPSAQVSQAGAARGRAKIGPAGVINPGPPQKPLEGKYTDSVLSRTLQKTILEESDPQLIHLIPGNEDTNLRLYRQIADLSFRGANTREVKQYLKLSDEEIAQHYLRSVQEAARTLQQLSAYRQTYAKTLDEAAEAMSMGGALEGMLGGPPPLIVGARGRTIGRVGSIEPERTLEALAEETRSFDQAMLANTLQKPRKAGEMELLQSASYPFMISKWATAVRNAITQGGRYTVEALDDALTMPLGKLLGDEPSATLGGAQAAYKAQAITRPGAYVSPKRAFQATLQDIFDISAQTLEHLSPEDARATLKVLTEFPTEAANFLGWASSAGEEAGVGPSKFRLINSLLDPKLQRLLTVFNRAQEFTGRALVYDASVRAQLRARGLDPNEILQLPPEQIAERIGGATVLDELIHNSVAGALEATFASRAAKDSIPGALLRFVNQAWPLKLGYPFPKFNLVAAPRFVWDHGPWALLDLVRFPLDAAGVTSGVFGGGRLYRGVRAAKFERADIPELVGKRQAAEGRLGSAVRDLVASRRELAVRNRLVSRLERRQQAGLPGMDTPLQEAMTARDQLSRRVERAQAAVGEHKSSIRDLRSQEETLLQAVRDAHGIGAPTLPQYFARVATGTFGLLGSAFVIRSQPGAQGTKWYEYRIDREGKDPITLDFRPFAPFAQYLFVADVMQDFYQHTDWDKVHEDMQENAGPVDWSRSLWNHYTGKYTGEELGKQFTEAFLSMSRAAGTTLTISELMTQNGWPSPAEAADAIIGTVGQFLSRFTVPFQQVKDVAGQFDPEEAKARITPRATLEEPYRPLADPLANIPYASEVIPERISQTTGRPVATEYPLLRALAGIGTAPKDFVTQEVQRVGVPGQSVFIRETGDYPLDRVIAEQYSRVLQAELPDILEADEYRQLGTPADQRDYLQRYIFPALKRAALAEVRDQMGEEQYQGATVRGETARRKQRQLDLLDRLQGELGPAPADDTGADVPDLPPGPPSPASFGAPPPAGP